MERQESGPRERERCSFVHPHVCANIYVCDTHTRASREERVPRKFDRSVHLHARLFPNPLGCSLLWNSASVVRSSNNQKNFSPPPLPRPRAYSVSDIQSTRELAFEHYSNTLDKSISLKFPIGLPPAKLNPCPISLNCRSLILRSPSISFRKCLC